MDSAFYIFFWQTNTSRYPGTRAIERFLSDLAVKGEVSALTQRQALNALVFLYDKVLDIALD